MYRLNHYFSWVSVFLITVFLLAACAPAPTQQPAAPEQTTAPEVAVTEAAAEGFTVGIFLPDKKTMRYDTKDRPIFTEKMKELCPNCEVIGHISDSDAAEQQSAVEQAITNGAKVVAIMAVDTKAAAVIADYAKERGVPVIAYSRLLENSDGVTVNIAFALADIGKAQAESLMEALNKKGIEKPKIVMINGGPSDSNMPPIRDGAMSVFQPLVDQGKIEIVKSVDTPDWDPNKAQSEMEQILTETGGEIDGVYVMNDGMASGVVAALNSAGIKPLPPITGLDAELAAVQRILTGEQYSSVFLPIENMATKAAEIAYDLGTSGEVPADMIDGTINNGAIDVPSVYIPVDNVDITNIKEKIIDTGFWTLEDICTPEYEQACKDAGLQ
jgi:D-xylose transport system substrate-binding protein